MSGSAGVARGAEAIASLLSESPLDLRTVGVDAFRAWLRSELPDWRRDPVFARQEAIRDLRRAHPRLLALEAEERRALAADEASPAHAALQALERESAGVTSAIAGLSGALAEADEERRGGLLEKLRGFEIWAAALEEREARLLTESPERRRLLHLRAELARVRAESGVEAEESSLAALLASRGRRSGRAGHGFEEDALEAARGHIVPELPGATTILRGVTLGAAAMEIDQLVVRRGAAGEPVEVLAMVEAKRNPNDLGGGFRQRQLNLAWLTGDRSAYDPEETRTRTFPSGHFDRPVVHEEAGESFTVGPASFARFRRDAETGFFLDGLYLITRPGRVIGASAAALARIRHRAASDDRFDLEDASYLAGLLGWCRSLAHAVEASDVLRAYAAPPARARQILFIGR
jgi:hypothetical protein